MLSVDLSAPAPRGVRFDLRAALACGGAALTAAAVYLNGLHNPFVYDDYHTIVANTSILDMTNLRALLLHDITRPVTNITYAIDRRVWGADPFGFHVTNVLLHVVNVVLLFQFAWQLLRDRGSAAGNGEGTTALAPAFVAAALFAVHPMMTESVGYISGRSEVLAATFFLLALMAGRRWLRSGGAWWAMLTIGLWIVTVATKEVGAMFPFVLFAYDRLAHHDHPDAMRRRLVRVHLPFMTVAVLAGLLRVAVLVNIEYPGQARLHWSYVLIALDVARRYALLLIVPAGQTMFHEVHAMRGLLDPQATLAVGATALLVALAWKMRRVHWLASFGLFWFLLLLVPSSTLILFDQGEPMTEHRVYLASCGLFLAAGDGMAWLSSWAARAGARRRTATEAGLALVLLAYAALTITRNEIWKSPVTLWGESVDLAPRHYRPRLLLGEALEDVGRSDEAATEYNTAIELRPSEPTGYVKLGQLMANRGRFREARQHFREALRVAPNNEDARRSLVVLDQMTLQVTVDDAHR